METIRAGNGLSELGKHSTSVENPRGMTTHITLRNHYNEGS
jgi:hypothetical protein